MPYDEGMQAMPRRDTKNFRANLAARCAGHGTIQRVADDAGITRPHLSKIIHGHSVPTLEVASKIAGALGLQLSELLADPAEKKLAKAS